MQHSNLERVVYFDIKYTTLLSKLFYHDPPRPPPPREEPPPKRELDPLDFFVEGRIWVKAGDVVYVAVGSFCQV